MPEQISYPPNPSKTTTEPGITYLDDGELGSGDVKSIDIWGQASEGLLGSIGAEYSVSFHSFVLINRVNIPDKGVDLDGVNIVKLLKSLLDLALVGLDVDNEDEGVVLLNLLHRALGVERVDDDLVLIQAGLVRNALAGVLGRAREDQGLRAVEGRRETDLAGLVGVHLLRLSAPEVPSALRERWGGEILTPLRAAFAASLAFLLPLPALEAPPSYNASAFALVNSQ